MPKKLQKLQNHGQFLEIRVQESVEPLLRRPISIHSIEGDNVEFIFQVKGKGTEILKQKEIGEEIDIIGPLGYGSFDFEGKKNVAIIGGGIGIFPLYELAKQAKKQAKVNMYLGFRNRDYVVLEEKFKNISDKFVITTDDGSYGNKGFAINFLKEDLIKEKVDCIYGCGPLPLLKALQSLAEEMKIPCQISLEERMGCGIGACLGCAVKLKTNNEETEYAHVCKLGPVFNSKEVEI